MKNGKSIFLVIILLASVTGFTQTGSRVLGLGEYVGATNGTSVNAAVIDAAGNIVLVGETGSGALPVTANAFQSVLKGNSDGFLIKLNPSGTQILYATYLGGGNFDQVSGVATDSQNNIYVTGTTSSTDFPTSATAFSKVCSNPCNTPFVTKFGGDGSMKYSTYAGGDNSTGASIAVDPQGNAYITGTIASSSLPLVNAYQSNPGPVYVQKVDASGSSLLYSTYFGSSSGTGSASGIAVDAQGSAYLTGNSAYDPNFPLVNPIQAGVTQGGIFISKFAPDGKSLKYSTLLGGYDNSSAFGVAADANGNVYVVGTAASLDFPTLAKGFRTADYDYVGNGGWPEGFLISLNATGTALRLGTFLGVGRPSGVTVDNLSGTITVAGVSPSPNFPLLQSVQLPTGKQQAFVMQFDASGTLLFSTIVGGRGQDVWTASVGTNGDAIYVSGTLQGGSVDYPNDFPLVNTSEANSFGLTDYLAKITSGSGPVFSLSPQDGGLMVLRNVGSSPMTINNISVSTVAGTLQMSHTCDSTLEPGEDCLVNVIAPNPLGGSGTLTIATNAPGSPATFHLVLDQSGGPSPEIVYSPQLIQFEPTMIGQSRKATMKLSNAGFADGNISVTAQDPNLSIANNCPASLAAGKTCTVDISFRPTTAGWINAQASVTTDVTRGIFVNGFGSADSVLAPLSHVDFATQIVGTAGPARIVTLKNFDSEYVSISNVAVNGKFSQTNDCALLAPGQECRVAITYSPTTNENSDGTLTATQSGSGGPISVPLSGTGRIQSDLRLSSYALEFGNATVGTTSLTQAQVTVTNVSAKTVNISGVTVGSDFGETDNCVGDLAAGASCTVTVSFTPQSVGDLSELLSIVHNGVGSPQTASLHGTGLGAIYFMPQPDDFGSQVVGTTSEGHLLNVDNSSRQSITVTDISVGGSEFQIIVNPCTPGTVLPPTYGCAVYLTLTPSATGLRQATVTVTTSAGTFTGTVQGTGLSAGVLGFSPTSLDFGTQTLGSTSTKTVTMSNSGTGTAAISSITTQAPYSQTNNCGASLAAGASCAISIKFAPTAPGVETGYLTVADDTSGGPHTVPLSGTGAGGLVFTPDVTSLTFANTVLGGTSASQQIKIKNTNPTEVALAISVNGDFTMTTTCGNSVAVGGECAVNVAFAPTVAGMRTGTLTMSGDSQTGSRVISLNGEGTDFQLGASTGGSTSQTVSAGQTASFNLQLTGAGGFTDNVTLACATVPTGYTCNVNPTTVSVGATPAPFTVSVGTPPKTALMQGPSVTPRVRTNAGLWATMFLPLFWIGIRRRKAAMLAVTSALLIILVACGGGGGSGGGGTTPVNPPPVTKTVGVTATSSTGIVRTISLTVTVQ